MDKKNKSLFLPLVSLLTIFILGVFFIKNNNPQPGLALRADLNKPTYTGTLSGSNNNGGNINGPSPSPTPSPAPWKVYVMGGSNNTQFFNDVWSSVNNLNKWTLESQNQIPTPLYYWPPSNSFCAEYFDKKIFTILPGQQIWLSSDGKNWMQTSPRPGFAARTNYECAVFNNEIWLSGGYFTGSGLSTNEIYRSSNGYTWFQVIPSGQIWSPRIGHTMVSFDNKLWVMGGTDGTTSTSYNDVWSSPDGVNWTLVTPNAPWQERENYTTVVNNNEMYVIGGLNHNSFTMLNDVWSSPDGINWTQLKSNAPWDPREYHSSFIYNGRIWVVGGSILSNPYYANDVWSSPDGINWTQETNNAGWPPRIGHEVAVTPQSFGSLPDIRITSVSVNPADLHYSTSNQVINYSMTIENNSNVEASMSSLMYGAYYKNPRTNSLTLVGASWFQPILLAPQATQIIQGTTTYTNINLRAILGKKDLVFVADDGDIFKESNENNNTFSTTIEIVH